jgi:hypothetical protein
LKTVMIAQHLCLCMSLRASFQVFWSLDVV